LVLPPGFDLKHSLPKKKRAGHSTASLHLQTNYSLIKINLMAVVMGRLTGDAIVKTIGNDKQLVEFSVAENFRYKPKNGEVKESVTFYNCVIWNRPNIAPHLKKGKAIIITGKITAEAYKDKKKQPKASLKFIINNLQFPPSTVRTNSGDHQDAETNTVSDMPF
jgi:single-strand DNA-binding protein